MPLTSRTWPIPPRESHEHAYNHLIRWLSNMPTGDPTYQHAGLQLWTESSRVLGARATSDQRSEWIFARLREEGAATGADTPTVREGSELHLFPGTSEPVMAHRHTYYGDAGGWVADTASVAPTAWVDPGASVFEHAIVQGHARIQDRATVRGNALVEGYAGVFGSAVVSGNAVVSVDSAVYGNALVTGNARVTDGGRVFDRAVVEGNAYVGGYANVHGSAVLTGAASIGDNDVITEGTMSAPVNYRRCTRCRNRQRETSDNFSQSRGRFNSWCRECMRVYARERRAAQANNLPNNRRFGVEIEFHGSRSEATRALNAAGIECEEEGYNHQHRSHWKIVPDGSVSAGGELVSPILRGEDGFSQIRKACQALRASGATVSLETGLHVHHDVAGLRVSAFKRMVHNWRDSQDAIDTLVAPSRRGHQNYTSPLTPWDLELVDSLDSMTNARSRLGDHNERFRAFNVQAYGRHGTVEVRQHQGTLNADKIIAWVKFGQAFILAAVDGTDIEATDGEELLAALGDHLDSHLRTYLTERIAVLASARGDDEGTRRHAPQYEDSNDDEDYYGDDDDDSPCECEVCVANRSIDFAEAF
jgi:carbonic anhydrase/acetyltransferase-like protein (isoleucine patch superfamily)